MMTLSQRFIELENSTYKHLGHVLTSDLSPEIAIVLDAASTALGYSVEGLTGDRIALALRRIDNHDLIKELRAVVTIYNAVTQGE